MLRLLCLTLILLLTLPLPAGAEAATIAEGDVVIFGRCEQDGDPDNGPEPLQWIVLEAQDDALLLITQYEIAFRPYRSQRGELVSWADSELRAWLNEGFLAYAFTDEERALIPETALHTPGGERTIYRNGQKIAVEAPSCDTVDRVFVLSSEETERYFAFGGTYPTAIQEHHASIPVYGLMLKLMRQGMLSWENVNDLPDTDTYAAMAGRLLPRARQTGTGWTLALPNPRDYSRFWQEEEENHLLQPWLLREHGMVYYNYSDGSGSPDWYSGYCWDPACVRPVLRVSRSAMEQEQGLMIRPVPHSPTSVDPALIGLWTAEHDGVRQYYQFDADSYHMRAIGIMEDEVQSIEFLCLSHSASLEMIQIGTGGRAFRLDYAVSGDRLILKMEDREIVMQRADEIILPPR